MAYFPHREPKDATPHERRFLGPVVDDDPYDELGDTLPGEEQPEALTFAEELAERRRGTYQVLSGVGDFLAVIAGVAIILILIAVLISLVNWVYADMVQSFQLLQPRR